MRKNIKDVEYQVRRLNKRMNVSTEKYLPYKKNGRLISNVGHFYIGHAYGTYRLEKIVNEFGGCSDITISTTKTNLYYIIKGMVDILDEQRYKEQDLNEQGALRHKLLNAQVWNLSREPIGVKLAYRWDGLGSLLPLPL